jgi:hypothetical protein
MAFRATVVFLLMSSVSSKYLFQYFLYLSEQKKEHWGLDPANGEGAPAHLFVY